MVPDFKLIMENMFMGEGFTEAKALGLKFSTLYALNKDLLSQSKKYDWGMRAIKSVLVVAGGFKRADASLSEQAVLMRSLRDTNVAKIEGDDLKIFMGLLLDLFPGIDVPRARDYDMEEVLVRVMEEDASSCEPHHLHAKGVVLHRTRTTYPTMLECSPYVSLDDTSTMPTEASVKSAQHLPSTQTVWPYPTTVQEYAKMDRLCSCHLVLFSERAVSTSNGFWYH
eukprot:3841136-Amphidinium_carterae.1